uniref:Plectin/eS10 N-terminal domain-containing protein n=1 Tax=Callorhinchus milii TaxID=7868 RepID=A0A4W3GI06_CALMI
MLMPLASLRAVYELLFRDGVLVAKADTRPQSRHPELEGVSNLQVMRAMTSLSSRGFVRDTFVWRHHYWYLTNEGICYLRDYLHLPAEIVPASLQRGARPRVPPTGGRGRALPPRPVTPRVADHQRAVQERAEYRKVDEPRAEPECERATSRVTQRGGLQQNRRKEVLHY